MSDSPFKDTWPAWQVPVNTSLLDTDMLRIGWPKPTIYREHETIHVLANLVDQLRREREVVWLAGLYEGEGTLVKKVDNRNGSEAWELTLHSTDEDVVRRAQAVLDVGHVTLVVKKQPKHQNQWRWRVSRRADVERTLTAMLPHLGLRRGARAREFFEWSSTYARRVTRHDA